MRFYKEDLPTILVSNEAADGDLRAFRARCGEGFTLETGECAVLTIHLNEGWRVERRSSGKFATQIAQPGRIRIVRPGTRETITSEGGDSHLLQLRISMPTLDAALKEDHDEPRNLDAFTTVDGQVDLALTRIVARAMLQRGGVREVMIRAVLAHLMGWYGVEARPLASRGLSPVRLRRVKDLVSSDLANVRLDTMAAEASLSQFHFAREFKRDVGITPWDYVVQRRVWAALNLLAGRHSADEAAKAVGFVDKSHLGRAVRRHMGVSPRQAASILYPV